MITQLSNKLWLLSQKSNHQRFLQNKSNVASVQYEKLNSYLKENQYTDFGKKYAFGKIKTYADYAKAIPIIEDYHQLNPFIERIMQGHRDVLFKGKPLFLESTSGSSGQAKYIPYNHQLKRELDTAISAWMWNLYRLDPLIFKGKAYWSLSPALKEEPQGESKIPIGSDSDMDYFNPLAAFLLRQIMAVSQPSSYQDADDFYLQTWKQLLENKNLTFISVWSPQFLLRLMDFLKTHQKVILNSLNYSKREQVEIQNILEKDNLKFDELFPQLRLISCWTQAQSAIWLSELKKLTGNIPIQGKGLLSTEGVVSIPWGLNKQLLSYHAHFYEFKGTDDRIYLAHQLQEGVHYECIITTAAGLYRYNTHDLVKCKGFMDAIPALEFMGRAGNISDLVGEKVSERSISEIYIKVKNKIHSLKTLMLLPHKKGNTAEYYLLVEGLSEESAMKACVLVHQELLRNPYYRQAIAAGQLCPLQYQIINEDGIERISRYYQKINKIKDGDLKLPLLFPLGFYDNLKEEQLL